MMKKQFAIPALALAMATSSFATVQPFAVASTSGFQDHDRSWDTPPADFREVQTQGFHDGVEGARKDYDKHRHPDVNNRDEYRHPHVAPSLQSDYREGFRRGYEAAWDHMMHANANDLPH